jgi:hypothetical protein
MKKRKIVGILFVIAGVVLIFLSKHIDSEVSLGRAKISRGQSQIDTIDSIFSSSSYTRGVGKVITKSGQRQINEGIRLADHYEEVARWCLLGGIGCIVVGAGLFLIPGRRK